MNSWHSYPSIYTLGHSAISQLLTVPVNVEEKIDGSQFSFGIDTYGEVFCRSKGAMIHVDAPENMFARAIESVLDLKPHLIPEWTYRAEYLQKPKHNTLAYDRIPAKHFVLFDVNTGEADYLSHEAKGREAARLGLEAVPLLYSGMLTDVDKLRGLLDTESVLGGCKIEGVVVKQIQPSLFGPDKKALIGKFVSEQFKEVHGREWRKANPSNGDIILEIATSLRTEARWQKAVQHLRESGTLQGSPRDIGLLLKEIQTDIHKECADEIRDRLFKYAWPKIARILTVGMPEWYKSQLLVDQFDGDKRSAA